MERRGQRRDAVCRAAAWLAVAAAAVASGCGGDDGARRVQLVLTIAADVPARESIDAVEVTLTASRTPPDGALALCEPATCSFSTGGGVQPVIVEFRRGATYAALALFRVTWLAGGVAQATREAAVPWPDSGAREVRLELSAACAGRTCPAGLQCMPVDGEGRCAAVPFPGAFDDRMLVDEGVPCGREDEPLACPVPDGGNDADAGADVPEADRGEADVGDGGADAGDGGEADDGDAGEAGPSCTPPTGSCPAGTAVLAAGPFVMGSDPGEGRTDEEPEHVVTLSGVCIGLTEVTNEQYRACMDAGVCTEPAGGANSAFRADYLYAVDFQGYPVVNVTWDQAQAYCAWTGGRLPSEAEWEKSCRGGCETTGDPALCDDTDERTYPWGEATATCSLANFAECLVWGGVDNDTDHAGGRPDGAQPADCAMDLAGNVREFVADWYDSATYAGCIDPCTDPSGPATGTQHVTRGGSFDDTGAMLRCARRQVIDAGDKGPQIGFRCASTPP